MKAPPTRRPTARPQLRGSLGAAAVVLSLCLAGAGVRVDDPPATPPAGPETPPAQPNPAPPSEPTPTTTPPATPPTTPPTEPVPTPDTNPPAPAPTPKPTPEPAKPESKEPAPAPAAPVPSAPPLDDSDPRNDEVEATVILTTGERVTGVLIEDKVRSVTIRVGGIATTFTADQVDQVQKSPPFRERYKLFSESAGSDPEQIVKVADWLAARERYELALYEVERALAVDPNNSDAKQRRVRLTKQLELADRARRTKESRQNEGGSDGRGSKKPASAPRPEFPLLTTEQINVMRVYEINLKDPPNMVIDRATIQRLIDSYAGNPLIPVTREGREAFFRKSPADILDVMFKLRAREFYGEVRVLETPDSIRRFRDDVERTWLLNSCATTDCHGGTAAGRLQLTTRRAGSDASVATNLLILDRFKLADGSSLIDYDKPERSALLQYALPRTDAFKKHPPVPVRAGRTADAVKSVFRDPNDLRFQAAVDWVRSMYSPRPEYPITYTPPGEPKPAPAQAPGNPGGAAPGSGPAGGGGPAGGVRPEADKSVPPEQPKPR